MNNLFFKTLGILCVFLFTTNTSYGFFFKSKKKAAKELENTTSFIDRKDSVTVSGENIFSINDERFLADENTGYHKNPRENVLNQDLYVLQNGVNGLLDEEIDINLDQAGRELGMLDDVLTESLSNSFAFDTTSVLPGEFNDMLDHLLYSWMVRQSEKPECTGGTRPVNVSDAVYKQRLAQLPHIIEMPYNNLVRSMIEMYTSKKSTQLEYMLGISEYYFPVFEQALDAHGLPLELKYLPVIESALNTKAVSSMGAAGLWQFMIGTGRMYGLEINSLIDERMDPIKSTDAAIRFLKDLYGIYSDWHLAIAAYNCGPGNVNKAIRRAGGKRDFWAIYPYLPRETRGYVPIFIAANYAMNYAQEHNICPAKVDMPVLVDTIMVNNNVHFEQIAAVLDIPVEQIRTLNPQYRRDIIPGDSKPYSLCLPLQYANAYIENFDAVRAYRADELVNNRRKEVEAQRSAAPGGSGNLVYHKVKSGETLGHIAQKYGTSATKIRSWNNISGSTIYAGQRLKIYK